MNNRLTMALAVAGGYVLGRTKKAKFAFGVATMVAGKRLKLDPQALVGFAKDQLANNPQFKELGDQLRTDLRGAGKAATGALVNRQVNALADRLHERTLDVRGQLSGASDSAKETAGNAVSTAKDTAGDAGAPGQDGEERDERADGERESEAPADSRSSGTGAKAAGGAQKTAGRARKSTGTAKKSAAQRPATKQSQGRATGKKAASSSSGTARSSSRSSTAKRTGTASAAKPASTRAKGSGAKGGRSRG
ncbi:DNA primase [Streptomyces tubbatahanensis]|uniref:DNA primase n=1 Tax=Streptomyces tubbatahanensis TaxID=2923272 RepID=A0ABY3XP08_9ACTN|nr:DNA primase [Streptomyces tubbatahanensis]UNS96183.1 DNA primase [Streptomyces tubbatahanensis]